MAPPAKGRKPEEKLIAIVLGDSFDVHFRPITTYVPRALIPLCNIPVLEYTLEFLAAAAVDEIIVFCVHLGQKINEYLLQSRWNKTLREGGAEAPQKSVASNARAGPVIHVVVSKSAQSVGDALREVYDMDMIRNDFVLISGDVVSNFNLTSAIEKHRSRREKDKSCMMTMVMKPRPSTEENIDDLCVVLDPNTDQILAFEKLGESRNKLAVPLTMFSDSCPEIEIRTDLEDCFVDVCASELLFEFKDNFDYQDIRKHFVTAVVNDEILGRKIYAHKVSDREYVSRVKNLPSYKVVTRDVMHRWTYPFVPDVVFKFSLAANLRFQRPCFYLDDHHVVLSRSCVLENRVFLGSNTTVGEKTLIRNTVVGSHCKIGADCKLVDCILWDHVVINDGVVLENCIVCSAVEVESSFETFSAKVFTPGGIVDENTVYETAAEENEEPASYLKSRVKPRKPSRRASEDRASDVDETESYYSESPSEGSDGDDDTVERIFISNETRHLTESIDTIKRAVSENISVPDALHEVNGLKFAYDASFQMCTRGVLTGMLTVSKDTSNGSSAKFLQNLQKILTGYSALLTTYASDHTQQLAVIGHLEKFFDQNVSLSPCFVKSLHFLYESDVLSEDSIVAWSKFVSPQASSADDVADDSPNAVSKNRRKYVDSSAVFLKWLAEAEEESEDEDDADEDDE
eukprot:ANDGO_08100.mRNA.1 putative translation initiation factor eIF-2B subunit epsilon